MRTTIVTLEELLMLALVDDSCDWDAAELGLPAARIGDDEYQKQEEQLEHFAAIAVRVSKRFRDAIRRAEALNGPTYNRREPSDAFKALYGPDKTIYVCDGEHAAPACSDNLCRHRRAARYDGTIRKACDRFAPSGGHCVKWQGHPGACTDVNPFDSHG